MPKKAAPSDFHYEKALTDLEKLVEKMEQGDLPLEQALSYFEEGIALAKQCQTALTKADQKVKTLIEKQGEMTLTDFNPDTLDDTV